MVRSDVEVMRVKDLQQRFEREFTYPLTSETLLEQAGDDLIEAPDRADSVTLASVLELCGVSRFSSPFDLYYSVVGNLDDAFIGRKFYDDRGTNHLGNTAQSFDDTVERSF